MPEISIKDWDTFTAQHPDVHLLQTAAWGELKAGFGWEAVRLVKGLSGAQVLFRRLPLGLTMAYIPKGPQGEGWLDLWSEVDAACLARKAIFLKVELDGWSEAEEFVLPKDFVPSAHAIQPRRTIIVNLEGSEEEILAGMKQKTRYNIRLAGKKGVEVRASADIRAFSEMVQITGQRDGFGVHNLAYYQCAYDLFHPQGNCELLQAEYEGQPLAALMVFAQGKRAWYLYGASNNQERNRMPTYLLQWEAMRWARQHGCTHYDFWGVPDEDEEVLETEFMQRSDGLWGVYRFKRGFGGRVKRAKGARDKVYMPNMYAMYKLYFRFRGV